MTLVPSSTPLTHFKLLSFDVYGTLIDWEGGIYTSLTSSTPFSRLPTTHPLLSRKTLLLAAEERERSIQAAHPDMDYSEILSEIFKSLIQDHDVPVEEGELDSSASQFANSVGSWPAFPDTLAALKKLKEHYYLVPLTNSSPRTFGASLAGPFAGFDFSAYYTAADIGSYKPDLRNFEYLFQHVKQKFGVEKAQILHVAQSFHHDHEPAAKLGLESCWVDRNGVMGDVDAQGSSARFGWKVQSLGELAEMVEKAFKGGK